MLRRCAFLLLVCLACGLRPLAREAERPDDNILLALVLKGSFAGDGYTIVKLDYDGKYARYFSQSGGGWAQLRAAARG